MDNTMIHYNDEYEKEIVEIINNYPKCYVKMLKSKGFKRRYNNRQYLVDYIYSCTPLLSDDIHTFKTRIYWTIHRLSDFPLCKNDKYEIHKMTNVNVKKISDGYPQYCNAKCQHEAPSYFKGIKDSMKQKYGVENAYQIESVKKDLRERKDEIQKKKNKTLIQHFGTCKGWNIKKSLQTRIERYGCAWNQQAVKRKKFELHGNKNWNNPIKNYMTKKANGNMNTSKSEEMSYTMLIKKFGKNDILRQYRSDKYPYACDFYVKSIDTYIECNYCWTHGGHLFNENNANDIMKLEKWKNKGTKYYLNAIDTWTRRDIEKHEFAKKSGICYKAFWKYEEFEMWINDYSAINCNNPRLELPFDEDKLNEEFLYFKNKKLTAFPKKCKSNYIIKCFQQDTFFREEKEMWASSRDLREQLIINRCMYLNKNQADLTAADMLASFKISGKHYGYSHFNPLQFKWFIQKYGIKTCYDPCGGWGHRLLGSQDLDLYIYNDLSESTKHNVDKMIEYFNISNCHTYCNDAKTFIPEEDFEAMYTCPPYFNLEHYECGDFKDILAFEKFINCLFDIYHKKENCKIFGLVIREDMLFSHTDYIEHYVLNENKTHLIKNKKTKECMFIFRK